MARTICQIFLLLLNNIVKRVREFVTYFPENFDRETVYWSSDSNPPNLEGIKWALPKNNSKFKTTKSVETFFWEAFVGHHRSVSHQVMFFHSAKSWLHLQIKFCWLRLHCRRHIRVKKNTEKCESILNTFIRESHNQDRISYGITEWTNVDIPSSSRPRSIVVKYCKIMKNLK